MNSMESFEHSFITGVSRETQANLESILRELEAKTSTELILLSDIGGQIICSTGSLPGVDKGLFTALLSSYFAALGEIGKQIGEDHFSVSQWIEGKIYRIFLTSVNDCFFLILVFKKGIQNSILRNCCSRAIINLRELLRNLDTETMPDRVRDLFDGDSVQQFDRSVNELLDETEWR